MADITPEKLDRLEHNFSDYSEEDQKQALDILRQHRPQSQVVLAHTPKPPTFVDRAKSVGQGILDTLRGAATPTMVSGPGGISLPNFIQGPEGGNLKELLPDPSVDKRGASLDWGAGEPPDILSDVRPLLNLAKSDPARAIGQVAPIVVGGAIRLSPKNLGSVPNIIDTAPQMPKVLRPVLEGNPLDILFHPKSAFQGMLKDAVVDVMRPQVTSPSAASASASSAKPLSLGELKAAAKRGAMKPEQFEGYLRNSLGYGEGEAQLLRENLESTIKTPEAPPTAATADAFLPRRPILQPPLNPPPPEVGPYPALRLTEIARREAGIKPQNPIRPPLREVTEKLGLKGEAPSAPTSHATNDVAEVLKLTPSESPNLRVNTPPEVPQTKPPGMDQSEWEGIMARRANRTNRAHDAMEYFIQKGFTKDQVEAWAKEHPPQGKNLQHGGPLAEHSRQFGNARPLTKSIVDEVLRLMGDWGGGF